MDQQTNDALQKLVTVLQKAKQGEFVEDLVSSQENNVLASVVSEINELLSIMQKQQVQLDAEMAAREQIQDVCRPWVCKDEQADCKGDDLTRLLPAAFQRCGLSRLRYIVP